jgi:glycosyltransferase involved in cell wall biosynthesis
MAARLETEGCRALLLRPLDAGHIRLEQVSVKNTPNLIFAVPEEYWTLRETLLDLGVEHIHIQHTIGVPTAVLDLVRDLGLPYDYTIHDYYPICPRITLIDETDRYCGEPEPAQCNNCLEKNGALFGGDPVAIQQWRQQHGAWLAGARKVIVPHRDVAVRLARYFPDIQFTERRHFETMNLARPIGARYTAGDILRVVVIGMIGVHKGSDVLLGCARDAATRKLPIHFHVVGFTDRDDLLRELPNVSITGRYREEEVFDLLEPLHGHCAFFPSVWPETYCYTLSIALLGKLFPVAFDLGAPAERIRAAGVGHVFPLTTDAAAINGELLSLTPRLAAPLPESREVPASYPRLLADYYGLLWGRTQAA